jgi:arylsulfatase
MLPTLLAIAGEPDIKAKLLKGHRAGEKTFKVHIDGVNMLDYFTGKAKESPRQTFFYVNDDGQLCALRFGDWKAVFMEQRAKQFACWSEPFVTLRIPKLFHLRRDPFERADENSNSYQNWWLEHTFILDVAAQVVEHEMQSFVEFPPRQKPQSYNLDGVMDHLKAAREGGLH